MKSRAQLRLVVSHGIQRLAERERLIARAKRIFPVNPGMAAKWVEARLTLGERRPAVEIGAQLVNTSRALRRLTHGLELPLEIPRFLRRFVRR